MPRLQDKTALITGGTSGIGLATARRFIGEGVPVAVAGLGRADSEARAKAVLVLVPAGRFGRAEEIANAAVFLASDECPFMVGAERLIDGGLSAA